jgi:phosphatidylglycerophosphate synthase
MRVKIPTYLPNLLSSLRITLAPAMLGAAYSNSKGGFTALFVMALVTDALDGPIARRLGAASVVGQRLDRWGDGLTAVGGAVGVTFLWLEIIEREWVWGLVALLGYVMIGLQRLIEPAGLRKPPGWMGKLCGWLVPVTLVPLLVDGNEAPFAAAAVAHAAVGAWRLADARRKPHEPLQPRVPRPLKTG